MALATLPVGQPFTGSLPASAYASEVTQQFVAYSRGLGELAAQLTNQLTAAHVNALQALASQHGVDFQAHSLARRFVVRSAAVVQEEDEPSRPPLPGKPAA